MKTYDEAAQFYRAPEGTALQDSVEAVAAKLEPSRSLRVEIANSEQTEPILSSALIVLGIMGPRVALLSTLQMGVLIGMDMEKQDKL